MNKVLFSVIQAIASTVLIGVLMIVAFVTQYDTMPYILGAVAVGFLASLPIAFVVTKKLSTLTNDPSAAI
ncbi:MAG: hypothetical protein Q4G13_05960 [Moraxella sp.]|nr:hypothetical protein [Moraxella sp.]